VSEITIEVQRCDVHWSWDGGVPRHPSASPHRPATDHGAFSDALAKMITMAKSLTTVIGSESMLSKRLASDSAVLVPQLRNAPSLWFASLKERH
jgi:hypothetical protein